MSYLKGLAEKINNKSFVQEIEIDLLIPSENNFYGIREIQELAESIRESGLMHNLVVRKVNDKFEILSGERRYRALKSLDYKKVPCKVVSVDDIDAELLLIKANAEQRELTPTEKMEGIKRLEVIYKQKKAKGEEIPSGKLRDVIGKDMGLSGTQVGRYQKVDKKLIEPLKNKLDKGELTLNQAETLTKLNKEEQKAINNQIDTLDPGNKVEKDILIQGIKQPVETKEDEELLKELDEDNIQIEIQTKLKELLEEYTFPKLIIAKDGIKATLHTRQIKIVNNTLAITLTGFGVPNVIYIPITVFRQATFISLSNNGQEFITPKLAFEVCKGIYLKFKVKEEQ